MVEFTFTDGDNNPKDGKINTKEYLAYMKLDAVQRGELTENYSKVLGECGGFFQTNLNEHVRYIKDLSNASPSQQEELRKAAGVTFDAADITAEGICGALKDAQEQISKLPKIPAGGDANLGAKK